MKTHYRVDVVFYLEVDTEKKMDAAKVADYLIMQDVFPFAVGYKGFKVRMGRATMTAKMLDRTPGVFKEAAKK